MDEYLSAGTASEFVDWRCPQSFEVLAERSFGELRHCAGHKMMFPDHSAAIEVVVAAAVAACIACFGLAALAVGSYTTASFVVAAAAACQACQGVTNILDSVVGVREYLAYALYLQRSCLVAAWS